MAIYAVKKNTSAQNQRFVPCLGNLVATILSWHMTHDTWHVTPDFNLILLALLSAHIERFSVSPIQDFCFDYTQRKQNILN